MRVKLILPALAEATAPALPADKVFAVSAPRTGNACRVS